MRVTGPVATPVATAFKAQLPFAVAGTGGRSTRAHHPPPRTNRREAPEKPAHTNAPRWVRA
jgi:hypothetical protein